MIKWLDKFLKCFSFELLKPHRIWSEWWRKGSENRKSELRGWNKVRVERVPQASPYGWSEREFQTLKERPKNQREMIPQHRSTKLSGEHQASFETLWSSVGDWWFPMGSKEERAPPRWGWRARLAPLHLQPSLHNHKLKQMRWLLRRPSRGNRCGVSLESSPHWPAISSQLQKPVNLTNSTPLILSHSVSSVPLKFCSSLFQSTTDSSWICQSRHYFTHAPPMAPHCPYSFSPWH